jgi:uncharacterized delta-60 repeat protein
MPDDKPVLGGAFTEVSGVMFKRVARLYTNGAPDVNFNQVPAFNASVLAVAVASNGRIAVGGSFTLPVRGIMRLRANGAVDTTFNPGSGPDGPVHCVLELADGRLLIGGLFTAVDGNPRARVARLNSDGSLDLSFAPSAITNGIVYGLAVQSDGKVLVVGDFNTRAGSNRTGIIRLNADGSVDAGFGAGIVDGAVFAVGLQSQGGIIVAGGFTTLNGIGRNRFARLLLNGAVDPVFDPGTGADGTVYTLAILPNDDILIGGDFTLVNNLPRSGVARIHGAGTFLNTRFLAIVIGPGQSVRLTLSTSPGRSYALDTSTNLLNWTSVGTYTATSGTLVVTDPNTPTANRRFYRAREVSP